MSGAGLVVASNTTLAELGLSHELTRKWRVWMHGGYANHSLIGRKRDINSGFAAAELHRTLGRHGSIFVAYYFQRQVSDLVCQQSVCASDLLRHSVGAGLDWQFPLARFK